MLAFLEIPFETTPAPRQPSLKHERFRHVLVGRDWPVVVGAVARAGVQRVELVYRPYGGKTRKTLPLAAAGDGLYGGTIPGTDIANNGLEYYARMVTATGNTVNSARGAKLPEVASSPYGDPAPSQYGRCAG